MVRVPYKPGDLSRWFWAFVLGKKCRGAGRIAVVVDDFIQNATSGIQDNDVIEVAVADVCGVIKAHKPLPLLRIEAQDGVVTSIRRIDGKTCPVTILIEQDGRCHQAEVDHRGMRDTSVM
jgi:hypothetical protein